MRILSEYLKYRIKILLLFLTAFAFPALTLSLYDLPTEPVLYAFALSGTVLAVSAVFDFVLFVRRHRRLSRVLLSVDADISVLPPPRNLPEEDLYRIISAIFEKKCAAESEKERTVGETADYYTMWVHQIKTPISAMRLLLQSGNADRAELEEQLFHIEEYVGMVLTYMRCEGHMSDFVMKRFPRLTARYAKQSENTAACLSKRELRLSTAARRLSRSATKNGSRLSSNR